MNEDLTKFRAQIDKIDDDIINLLRKRVAVVHEVGKHKTKASAGSKLSFIRPGREAQMLRDLAKKGEDVLPVAAIATIWRMIISSSLCIEQDMNIAVVANDEDESCFWLTREYYGNFVTTTRYEKPTEVIEAVANHQAAVGVLPLEVPEYARPWWVRPEDEKNDIYIFARIPFVEREGEKLPAALAIANVMPERTENDVSILAVHAILPIDEVQACFAAAGLGVKAIAAHNGNYLLEAVSFLESKDERLAKVKEMLGEHVSVRLLGAYAAPMIIPEKKENTKREK